MLFALVFFSMWGGLSRAARQEMPPVNIWAFVRPRAQGWTNEPTVSWLRILCSDVADSYVTRSNIMTV